MGSKILKGRWPHGPVEPIVPRTESDPGSGTSWWPAVAEVVPDGLMPFQQRLVAITSPNPNPGGEGGEATPASEGEGGEEDGEEGEKTLYGVEALLSALEALGVDNARWVCAGWVCRWG